MKDRLGKKLDKHEKTQTAVASSEVGPSASPEVQVDGQFFPIQDPGFVHHHSDVRTKSSLMGAARALADPTGERSSRGVLPVRQDLNTQFTTRQRRRLDRDPLLLQLSGTLPFATTSADVAKAVPGASLAKAVLDHDFLTPDEMADNCFQDKPRYHRKCTFCGSQHCSPYVKNTQTMLCLKFREHVGFAPTRDECLYNRCTNRKAHQTPACPSLHNRCSRCGLRGHQPHDKCDLTNPGIMERLRADFEAAARLGVYTKDRDKGKPAWGWCRFSKAALQLNKEPVPYLELTTMDALDAIATVEAINFAAAATEAETKSGKVAKLAPGAPPRSSDKNKSSATRAGRSSSSGRRTPSSTVTSKTAKHRSTKGNDGKRHRR